MQPPLRVLNASTYRLMSILVNNVSDTVINTFMIIAMIVGFVQIKHLKIDHLEASFGANLVLRLVIFIHIIPPFPDSILGLII